MTTIEYSGRKYRVKTRTIGGNFGTEAFVRIGAKVFVSKLCPYGFDAAAERDVVEAVERWKAAAQDD